MTAITQLTERHFGKKMLKKLKNKNINIVNVTFIPDESGKFEAGRTGYVVDDCGTSRVMTYIQVLSLLQEAK